MSDVNDYGMKVSRQGFPVLTAADYQLLFSSSFKAPMIIASGSYVMNQGGNPDYTHDQTIVTHNLGYRPVVLVFRKSAGSSLMSLGTNYESRNNNGLLITTTILKYFANSAPENQEYAYYIFNIDLETDYAASTINTTAATQGAITTDYGFKASNDGIDVLSAGLDDLSIFSGNSLGGVPVRQQLFHKIGGVNSLANPGTATIAHGLGYAPMFLWFRKSNTNDWYCMLVNYDVSGSPATINVRYRTYADATNIYLINTLDTLDLRYVIFKDPLVT